MMSMKREIQRDLEDTTIVMKRKKNMISTNSVKTLKIS